MHLNPIRRWALVAAAAAAGVVLASLALVEPSGAQTTNGTQEAAGWLDALNGRVCGKRIIKESPQPFSSGQQQHEKDTQLASYMSAGFKAYRGQFPWFVQLQMRFEPGRVQTCAGVLIHNNLVLTAAHCVFWRATNEAPDAISALAGLTHLDNMSQVQRRRGALVLVPTHFNPELMSNPKVRRSNDTAVIRVDAQFEYNDLVQPICLPESGGSSRLRRQWSCMAAGLGLMDSRTMEAPRNLLAMPMRVCDAVNSFRVDEICYESARPAEHAGRPCQGDGGGAMICSNDPKQGDSARFFADGVLSWSSGQLCRRGLLGRVSYSDLVKQRRELLKMARSAMRWPL